MQEQTLMVDHINAVKEEDSDAGTSASAMMMLDPEFMGKLAVLVTGVAGFAMNIAPHFMAKVHGSHMDGKHLNKRAAFSCSQAGAGYLSTFIFFYCLLFEQTSLFKAVQYVYVFWFYHQSRIAVNAGIQEPSVFWGSVAVFGFMVVAMIAFSESWARLVIQVSSAIWVAQGIYFVFSPVAAGKAWKSGFGNPKDDEMTPLGIVMGRAFGFWLLEAGVTAGSMSLGRTVYEAIGYASISCGAWGVSGVLSGEFKKAGLDLGPMLGWVLFNLAVVYATLMM